MIKGIDFKELERHIYKNYGPRCGEYCPGCIACSIWRVFDDLKSFDSWEELDEAVEIRGLGIEKTDTGLGLLKDKKSVGAKRGPKEPKKASNRRKK